MGKNIGFISTRFSGTDGVTLEASKWADVFSRKGHEIFWFAGELDREPDSSFLVPEAHFKHEENLAINQAVFGKKIRDLAITEKIHQIKTYLKAKIREFIKQSHIDLIVVENALTIPMHLPLGLALTETIAETQIPTIAHHHDFYWERTRYLVNAVGDFLQMSFPPKLPSIEHVVINSSAQEELALRTGISSVIIPNVLEFEKMPVINKERTQELRSAIGLSDKEVMILQPTRIVQRKGIEHAIEFVRKLGNPNYKLFISHEAGDEGYEYMHWLKDTASCQGVDLRLINTRIEDPWSNRSRERGRFSLWDVYPHADFITFPSIYEGFGNAFLEAVYFKKPILINRYSNFVRDIEPLNFDLVIMDQYLNGKTIDKAREVIESPERQDRMVNTNYEIALKHYSYEILRKHLHYLIIKIFGMEI